MIIVNYHKVLAHRPSAFNMLVRQEWTLQKDFERQMADVSERYQVVALSEITNAIREGRSLPDACAITFDDGYAGVYEYALPVLERLGLPATLFVVTGYVSEQRRPGPDRFDRLEALAQLTAERSIDLADCGFGVVSLACDACKVAFVKKYKRHTNSISPAAHGAIDQRINERLGVAEERVAEYLSHEAYRMMDWGQITGLASRGFAVGSHTRTHASLSALDEPALLDEIGGSFEELATRLGDRDLPFAYPYGKLLHMSPAAVAAVQEAGYSCGLTTIKGPNAADTDLFELRRVAYKYVKRSAARERS